MYPPARHATLSLLADARFMPPTPGELLKRAPGHSP